MAMMKFADAQTVQSTGAFLVGELERLDPTLYEPLSEFTALRDVNLRQDVTIADQVSSFMLSTYAANGAPAQKKSWAKALTSAIQRTSVAATKVINPITPWAEEVAFSIIELAQAQQSGRPIDRQKIDAMRMKHDLDFDLQTYFGDAELGVKGLLNSTDVTSENVGALSSSSVASDYIDAFNAVLNRAWENSKYTRFPKNLLVPPALFSTIASMQLPNTNVNLLNYIRENNVASASGQAIAINPCKYLDPAFGGSNTPRIVAYTKESRYVRMPLVPLQHTQPQFRGLDQATVYYAAFGALEIVYPQMMYYADLAD